MDIRELKYFLTVAHEGNFSRAADQLHITQPALSRQIMLLEDEIGVQLLERGKRHVTLTESGFLLAQRAKDILDLIDKTEREFSEQKNFVGGTVCVGCVETIAASFLSECIVDYAANYPEVMFNVYTSYTDDIRGKLDLGVLDIGILTEPAEIAKYDFAYLPIVDEWGAILERTHPLARQSEIRPSDLLKERLILPRRDVFQTEITSWLGKERGKANVVATHSLLTTSVLLVERGFGCAVGPKYSYEYCKSGKCVWLPFEPRKYLRHVMVWKKNTQLAPAVKKFIEMFAGM